MKKIFYLILCLAFISCEKESFDPDQGGYINFVTTTIESGYEVEENNINSWILIDGVTYNATCSNIEAIEPVMSNELAFIDLSSWISMLCISSREAVEILEERIVENITYRKYKMGFPVSYNGHNTYIYFIEERAFLTIADKSYTFPSPTVDANVAYNKETRKSDMQLNGKNYACYLVEIALDISCAEKKILGSTSFLALDEKE